LILIYRLQSALVRCEQKRDPEDFHWAIVLV
jgi:hypothetical protein